MKIIKKFKLIYLFLTILKINYRKNKSIRNYLLHNSEFQLYIVTSIVNIVR